MATTFSATAAAASSVQTGPGTIAGKYSELRIFDKDRSPVVFKDAKKYPLVPILMEKLQTIEVGDTYFKIFEDEDEPLHFTPSQASGATEGGTENVVYLAAASARQFRVGDVMIVDGLWVTGATNYTVPTAGASPEQIRVLAIGDESANTPITVLREGTTEIATTYTLIKAPSAMPDGWSAGAGYSIEESQLYNYAQNMEKIISVDENRENTRAYGEADMNRDMRKKRQSFNRSLSYAFHFGRRKLVTGADNRQRRNTGGLVEFIPSGNFTRLNGPATLQYYNGKSETWFQNGSDEKWAFIGPTVATYLSNKEVPFLVMNDELSDKFTFKIFDFETTHGLLHMVKDETFRGLSFANDLVIYDLDYIKFAYLSGMNIQIRENVQNPGDHFTKHEIYGCVGVWRTFADSHYYLADITG